jgi:hypothetical protein
MAHPAEMCYKIPDHVSFEEADLDEGVVYYPSPFSFYGASL